MPISLTTLLTTLPSIFHFRVALQLENLALRHQIGVLQRSVRNRPKLSLEIEDRFVRSVVREMSINENYEGEITPIRSNISRFSRRTVTDVSGRLSEGTVILEITKR